MPFRKYAEMSYRVSSVDFKTFFKRQTIQKIIFRVKGFKIVSNSQRKSRLFDEVPDNLLNHESFNKRVHLELNFEQLSASRMMRLRDLIII